ncbi:MAG TPA: ribonuclease III [Deltaproteobacteria bacterium]|nr:ribonuclease III [Deltaproteobacteria bacterium]
MNMGFFSFFRDKISRHERKHLKYFEKKLGYVFSNKRLLRRALSHKSYANEKRLGATHHNERYEYLGDAVLELAVSDVLMHLFPESDEGDLSKLRAAVVNETSLAELARKISVGDFMFLGRGEDNGQGRQKDSLLSDAFEAVLGAVYLDGGFKPAFKVVKALFGDVMNKALNQDITRDYKTKMQEESQTRFQTVPRYTLYSESGPDHDKTFEVHLYIRENLYGKGLGKSKKQAEQNAAQEALEKIVNGE